jgi:hypothetical protein
VFRLLYRLIAALARLAFRSGRSKDLEIIVLRHQLAVLRRQINRPALNDDDRTLLGAIAAALLIEECRHSVRPATTEFPAPTRSVRTSVISASSSGHMITPKSPPPGQRCTIRNEAPFSIAPDTNTLASNTTRI